MSDFLSKPNIEIIPSINVRTFEDVKERIKKVEPYVKWCHLDVTDGVFSKHETWRNPTDLTNLKTSLNVEVHLMISDPEKAIDQWLVHPVKRVIIHLEAIKDLDQIIKKCREKGIEIGIAINPDTTWENLWPYFGPVRSRARDEVASPSGTAGAATSNGVDIIQVLAVNPGPSGQELREEIYDKIVNIRKYCEKCIIEVDGGINPETAKKAVKSGANLLVAGNAIFSSNDISNTIENLRN